MSEITNGTYIDTGANIAALSTDQIAALKRDGVTAIDASDDVVSLNTAQVAAFETEGIGFASADTVTLSDTAANIETLTESQITALAPTGIDFVEIDDAACLTLTFSQAQAYAELIVSGLQDLFWNSELVEGFLKWVWFGAAYGDGWTQAGLDVIYTVVRWDGFLYDVGRNIEAMTPADLTNFITEYGIDAFDVSDDKVTLTVAQANVLAEAGVVFEELTEIPKNKTSGATSRDVVKIVDTGAQISMLTASQIAALKAVGVDIFNAIDDAVTLTADQAKAFGRSGFGFHGADVVTLAHDGSHLGRMALADLALLKTVGIDRIDISDDAVTLTAAQYKMLGTRIDFHNSDTVTVTGTSAADSLTARGSHMVLTGGDAADHLTGGAKHDTLVGGAGRDVLTGGAGADLFVFDTAPTGGDIDKISQFDIGHDHIGLDNTIFKAIGAKLGNGEFHIGATANDGNDYIFYNKATGTLSYDADGLGGDAAVQLATLEKNLDLTAWNFAIV